MAEVILNILHLLLCTTLFHDAAQQETGCWFPMPSFPPPLFAANEVNVTLYLGAAF